MATLEELIRSGWYRYEYPQGWRIVVEVGPGLYIRDTDNRQTFATAQEAAQHLGDKPYLRIAAIVGHTYSAAAGDEVWEVWPDTEGAVAEQQGAQA